MILVVNFQAPSSETRRLVLRLQTEVGADLYVATIHPPYSTEKTTFPMDQGFVAWSMRQNQREL